MNNSVAFVTVKRNSLPMISTSGELLTIDLTRPTGSSKFLDLIGEALLWSLAVARTETTGATGSSLCFFLED